MRLLRLSSLIPIPQKIMGMDPPYTIVGGVPAKPIKRRFPEETISALLEIQWWNWSEERIARNISAILVYNFAIPQLKQWGVPNLL